MKTYVKLSLSAALLLSTGIAQAGDNTLYGTSAGASLTSGTDNTFIGYTAASPIPTKRTTPKTSWALSPRTSPSSSPLTDATR